ncbi:MAG: 2,3-bisphosphoglycerate-independent phosphoglycerate mutase [bacterium]
MKTKSVVLIVRDGWGIASDGKYNAVASAKTPNVTALKNKYPNCVLEAAGTAVGLPEGYQGSSEVGHLNMGAGRIVEQELKRIRDTIEDGTLFKSPPFKTAIGNCLKKNSALHVMGLVQDEGVHAHQDHLFAIMEHAKKNGVKKLYIHFFSDGRDTPPRSALSFLKEVELKTRETGFGEVATVMGRYYAMDRGEKWNLIDMAYNALTRAEGRKARTAEEAIIYSYAHDKNPGGEDVMDEYIPPTVIDDFHGIKDGDSVIHFNYRQDRAIELTRAFVEDDYPGKRWKKLDIAYCGVTRYYDSFLLNALPPMDESGNMGNLLGEILSKNSIRQLRIAETQKFKHVTSFFNGKLIKPYPGEDTVEIKGTFDPSAFAEHPEMNAYDVAERTEKEIRSGKYGFVLVNFANCDMVGHTGNFDAVVKAVEVVDDCAGRLVRTALESGAAALVTADHGNAEEMWDPRINMAKTAHTCNLVEFILAADHVSGLKLRQKGILSDIAPAILDILGIPKPEEMTSESLII